MTCLKTSIVVDTTNVHRDEIQELKDYLEKKCWGWKIKTEKY